MRVCVLASSPITQGLRWFMLPWSDFTFTMCKVMEPSFICLPLSFSLSVKKKLTCRALPLKAKPSTKCWFSLPPGGFWVSQKEHFADLPSHSYEITRKEQLKKKRDASQPVHTRSCQKPPSAFLTMLSDRRFAASLEQRRGCLQRFGRSSCSFFLTHPISMLSVH